MELPTGGGSRESFMNTIALWVDEHYHLIDQKMRCKKCDAAIKQVTGFVSIHDKLFTGCTGSGKVDQIPIPFCPNCEGVPKKISSCIHE